MNTATLLIHSMGWSLIHSIWQGILVYVVLRVLLYLLPAGNARLRYRSAYLSLIVVLAWFAGNFYSEWQRLQGITIKVTEGGTDPSGARVFFIKTLQDHGSYLNDSLALQIERYFPLLSGVYILGVLFLCVRFVLNILQVLSYKRRGVHVPDEDTLSFFENLKTRLEINRSVKLMITERLNMPVVFGAIKPVILLPLASLSQLSPDQLEAILIHELGHIKRNDYLLNILQTVAETVLFFNPFAWMISSIIRQEREHCCDDLVLAYTSYPLPYVRALAILEANRVQPATFAMAAIGSSNHLLNRIKRIMETRKQSWNYSHLLISFFLIAALAVSVIWLTPAFAQGRKAKKEKQSTTEGTAAPKVDRVIVIDENGKRTEYNSNDDLPEAVKETIAKSTKAAEAATIAGTATAAQALKVAEEALKQVDPVAISQTVQEALKAVDVEAVTTEVNKALSSVEWEKVNAEIQRGMEEVKRELNDPKVREEVKASLRQAERELAHASEVSGRDMERARTDMERARADMERSRNDMAVAARVPRAYSSIRTGDDSDDEMVVTSNSYSKMLKEMERDGLIDRREGYEIRKKKNKLYINGELQSEQVYNRYSKYLNGKNISIAGDKENLSISVNN